jgi:hypothetical protein
MCRVGADFEPEEEYGMGTRGRATDARGVMARAMREVTRELGAFNALWRPAGARSADEWQRLGEALERLARRLDGLAGSALNRAAFYRDHVPADSTAARSDSVSKPASMG